VLNSLIEHISGSNMKRLSRDGSWRNRRSVRSRFRRHTSLWARRISVHCGSTFGLGLRAIAADMSGFTASIAGLTSLVQRSTVWSLAVTADVSELATSIALHGLGLAIASKMVGPTALVARRCAIVANETSAIATSVASSRRSAGATSSSWCRWIWAVALR